MFKGILIIVFLILFLTSCSKQNSRSDHNVSSKYNVSENYNVSEQYNVSEEYNVSEQYNVSETSTVNQKYDHYDSNNSSKLGTRIKANLRLILFVIF